MPLSAKQKKNLTLFDTDLRKFSQTIDADYDAVIKKVAFDLFRKIVVKTAVDTGRARVSWNISAGKPDLSTASIKTDLNKTESRTRALGKARRFTIPSKNSLIYITNNLPYIEKLENGHSKQAPRGMVRLSIVEVQNGIARTIREVTR